MSQLNRNNLPSGPGSPADDPILAEFANQPKRPWLVFLAGFVILLVIVGLVVGPLLYFALPGEAARWRIASAEEKRLDGDLDGAIADLDKALAQHPDNLQLLSKRAQWQIELKNYQAALQDYDRMIKLQPDNESLYLLRSQAYQFLGRHPEAIADLKKVARMGNVQTTIQRALDLNNLAYARALGNVEIDEALADMDEAIRHRGENASYLDTRGYLYYRQGDWDRAVHDLNRAVDIQEEEYEDWLERNKKGRPGVADRREMELEKRDLAHTVAVIRYHRMLVHEARGDKEKAEADRRRVVELGFEPNDQLF